MSLEKARLESRFLQNPNDNGAEMSLRTIYGYTDTDIEALKTQSGVIRLTPGARENLAKGKLVSLQQNNAPTVQRHQFISDLRAKRGR